MELGTTSEVIWELVMDEQAGLSEGSKHLMFSKHFTSRPNNWPACDHQCCVLVLKVSHRNTGNKSSQHTSAFSRHNLLGRKFRAFLTAYVPATGANFPPRSAKLMLRALPYFTVQQEGIMLPGITGGVVFNVFGYIPAATTASTVGCDPRCPGQVAQRRAYPCRSW